MNRHINFTGRVRRYNHNLSYRNFFAGEIGEMRPVWLEDGVPGDTFQYTPEVRAFFSPLIFPVLTSMKCRIDTFFVPNRLAWSEWENFYTGGPSNNLNPAAPSVRNIYNSLTSTKQGFVNFFRGASSMNNGLLDNLGFPFTMAAGMTESVLATVPYDMIPFYDYQFIYDEYYRDEEKEPVSVTGFGGIHRDVYDIFQDQQVLSALTTQTSGGLRSIAWAKDYFTSASLEQARGGDVPLLSNPMFKFVDDSAFRSVATLGIHGTGTEVGGSGLPGDLYAQDADSVNTALESVLTMNGLSPLYALRNWQNNNVVGGTRYIEQLRTRFHVVSSDARLQRPEFIGSSEVKVNIEVVTQTSSTVEDADTIQALGDRAGKAAVVGRGKTLTCSSEEFGWFISIMHIAPKASYFQGIRRNLQREDKFDYYTPEFEFLPQQEIRNNEIFADVAHMSPEDGGVFGYTGRYNEYKFHNDEVHGDFQDTLLAWTMARKFSALPSLASSTFLRVDHSAQGNNRIFAVPESVFAHIFGVVNNIVLRKSLIHNTEPKF